MRFKYPLFLQYRKKIYSGGGLLAQTAPSYIFANYINFKSYVFINECTK